ncbi:flagellar filament capping protein FliD [Halomonas sp. MCCC 1A17488]|uniref:flagellar filament capping protein FliD n=1 Tax=unclassified Halomonas TaxID=2609666 RepID=UPI0018D26D9C|nr:MULTISPECIES: flagellar filament capping protein FliD [unclassified Halomonas]MCE8014807.1 flagellar filament capping protein FliD [Halomonas sp. MCCC 1A17488]MCG3238140.1 flagellar filament capping protein FliD [Halomonas sp. MCCC 1A17488]QPP48092.1 flagellar filament capping protein FliD [Halomonas sp. SS10-MC5]
MASISSLGVGSGLDLSGLLDQLNAAERQKLKPITAQKTQEQAKISAYGRLQSGLTKFQDAVTKLNDAKLYQSLTTSVLGEGITATAGAEASPGRYEVTVNHTAKAGSIASQGVASTTDALVGAGGDTLTLSFQGKADVTVDLAEGGSLEDIRDAINANADAGVSASIINDGNRYRLVVNSKETGLAESVTGMAFANTALTEDTAVKVAGRDAELLINNITITSSSNRVEGAIQGVTLELDAAAAGKTATVVVERDNNVLKEAVKGFVTAYNEMKSTIGRMTEATGDADTAGELVGDRAVRTIESRLSRNLGDLVPGGDIQMLTQMSISLKPNGRLELDETKLDEVIASNPQALSDFFAGDSKEAGMAGRLGTTLEQVLGAEGLVKSSIKSSETKVDSLNGRYERMELSIERTIERYRKQFGQLDVMLAKMNSTGSYLMQQLDMLSMQMVQTKK